MILACTDAQPHRSIGKTLVAGPDVGAGHSRRSEEMNVDEADSPTGEIVPLNEAEHLAVTDKWRAR